MTFVLTKPDDILTLAYLLAAVLFIYGLKMLSKVKTAARGNLISATGMLLACVITFFYMSGGEAVSLIWIAIAVAIGGITGLVLALKVQMTAMPQIVALFNGFGGIASLLVACGDYLSDATSRWDTLAATGLAVLIGGVTFTGSLVAFGKLQGLKITPGRPVQFAGQKVLITLMVIGALALTGYMIAEPAAGWTLGVATILALLLGVLLVIGIGGADMPVVISLLNSYSGLATSPRPAVPARCRSSTTKAALPPRARRRSR